MQEIKPESLKGDLIKAGKTSESERHQAILGSLRPDSLAKILRDAYGGEPDQLLGLVQEMEVRDAHYRSVLGTRKTSLTHLQPIVEAASNESTDERNAAAVEAMLKSIKFEALILSLGDAIAKGYAFAEIIWDTGANFWQPREFIWRDPRLFKLGADQRNFVIKTDQDKGKPIPIGKMLVHEPGLVSGPSIFSGIGLPVAWCFLLKAYGLVDWSELLEIFGQPLRLGKYHADASDTERSALFRAVRDIGRDFAGIIPEGMNIEFISGLSKGGEPGYEKFLKYLDAQISKVVLGQTMTTDDGSSLAQANVHEEVRLELKRADAKSIAATLNEQLVRYFIDINFGPQNAYPKIILPVADPEDLAALSGVVGTLKSNGMKIPAAWAHAKFGIPEPEKGEAVLGGDPASGEKENEAEEEEEAAASAQGTVLAASEKPSAMDELLAAAEEDWERDVGPLVGSLEKAAAEQGSFEGFAAALPDLLSQDDAGDQIERLARATFIARGMGDAKDEAL